MSTLDLAPPHNEFSLYGAALNVKSIFSFDKYFSILNSLISDNFSFLFLTETQTPSDLLKKHVKNSKIKYLQYSTHDPLFPRGPGAAIFLRKDIAPFFQSASYFPDYAVSAWAHLPGRRFLLLLCIYFPHREHSNFNSQLHTSLLSFISSQLNLAHSRNAFVIIGGDFNSVVSPSTDRFSPHSNYISNIPEGPLHPLLISHGFLDSFDFFFFQFFRK
jgi:hypothetical protein